MNKSTASNNPRDNQEYLPSQIVYTNSKTNLQFQTQRQSWLLYQPKAKAQQNYGHITALRLIPYLLENPTSLCLKNTLWRETDES